MLYVNILSSVFYSYLCGADCLEDINTLAPQFSMMPNTIHPSSDTVGRGLKELKTENEIHCSEESSKGYKFNTADILNKLLLRMIKHLGLIKEGTSVDLDFDHQFIPAHKYDAQYSHNEDYDK